MASLSVYGYDQAMLKDPDDLESESEEELREATPRPQVDGSSKKCTLLGLPFELRRGIYQYLLPTTVETGHKGIAWIRGNTAIIAVNKQIHAEATTVMYGSNTFVLDIEWGSTTFAYQWLLPSGLVPKRTISLRDQLASRGMAFIRKLHVRVHHVDSYTGMIKYNYSGHGLTDGVKDQVAALCTFLRNLPEITKLSIEFRDGGATAGLGQGVLEPFLTLTNIHKATVGGTITSDFAEYISSRLNDAYTRRSFLRLPREIRDIIYRHLFASNIRNYLARLRTLCRCEHLDEKTIQYVRIRPVDLSVLYASRLINAEATPVLYQSRYFYVVASPHSWLYDEMPIRCGYHSPCEFKLPIAASKKRTFFEIRHLFFYPAYRLCLRNQGLLQQLEEEFGLFGKLLQEHPRIETLTIDFDDLCNESPRGDRVPIVREVMSELLEVRGVGEVKILHVGDSVAELFKVLESPKV